ncbi:MAG TPA: aminopeptidase P N-terminal domain-containing protein, partial [Gemmatimonadales bacterium]|nr:aminopeptidase P N-terminal domain-containing protein [Gemmatimonadales bacterium]
AFGARTPVTPVRPGQLPAFRYLTGFLEPDAALVIVARGGKASATLFTQPRDPRRQLYDGFPPDSTVIGRETGIPARGFPALRPMLDSLAASGLPFYELRDFETADYAADDSLTRGGSFARSVAAAHPGLEWRNAHPILDSLRTRKSAAEQAMLRRAIEITVEGHKEAMRAVRPGMYEYEVDALLLDAFRRTGGDGAAFVSIVGSGPNSTQYHYNANDRRMEAGEVVVMDIGAGFGGYAADVTRTVPVSGRFTPAQTEIYRIVRGAQAAAERAVKPGSSFKAWRDAAQAVVAQGVARLGLTQGVDATFDPPWADQCQANPVACTQAFLYMAHGLGHGIGLEVHDRPHPWYGTGAFAEGDVFTIEPGIYISTRLLDILPDTPKNRAMIAKVRPAVERYQNVGIRIEDDYLVTAGGLEWLSRAPRELAEVEAEMARRARPAASR